MKGSATGMSRMESISRKFEAPVGFSKGWRGIGVEEAAAVGAELLDRHLRCRGSHGDHLLGALQGMRLYVRPEVCTTPCDTSATASMMLKGSST